jgi:hypothetical protein
MIGFFEVETTRLKGNCVTGHIFVMLREEDEVRERNDEEHGDDGVR